MSDDGLTIRATNGPGFLHAMTAAVGAVGDMSGPMAAGGGILLAACIANAPRGTGNLARAHRLAKAGRNRLRLTVDTPYAAPLHWGWPAHGIKRRPWIVSTFNRNTAWLDRMEAAEQEALDRAAGATV